MRRLSSFKVVSFPNGTTTIVYLKQYTAFPTLLNNREVFHANREVFRARSNVRMVSGQHALAEFQCLAVHRRRLLVLVHSVKRARQVVHVRSNVRMVSGQHALAEFQSC